MENRLSPKTMSFFAISMSLGAVGSFFTQSVYAYSSQKMEIAASPNLDEAQILAPFAQTPVWTQILQAAQGMELSERLVILSSLKQSEDALEAYYASNLPNGKLQKESIFIEAYRLVEQVAVLEGYLQLLNKKVNVSISIPLTHEL